MAFAQVLHCYYICGGVWRLSSFLFWVSGRNEAPPACLTVTDRLLSKEPVGSANKAYFAGEYAWNGASSTPDADLASWFREVEKSPGIIGDTFWSLFGRNAPLHCDVSPM